MCPGVYLKVFFWLKFFRDRGPPPDFSGHPQTFTSLLIMPDNVILDHNKSYFFVFGNSFRILFIFFEFWLKPAKIKKILNFLKVKMNLGH